MQEDLGPIVIDPRAFKSLWPALGLWLTLFATAGDGWTTLRRQAALAFGTPAEAVIDGKRTLRLRMFMPVRRNAVDFSYELRGVRRKAREAVGAGWSSLAVGSRRPIHVLGGAAFLDDDLGYSRWKLWVFGAAFVALWLWAAARYRFG